MNVIEMGIKNCGPDAAIIDSIQTVYFPELSSGPGSVSQIRESPLDVLNCLRKRARHIYHRSCYQEGSLAGPKLFGTHGDRSFILKVRDIIPYRL